MLPQQAMEQLLHRRQQAACRRQTLLQPQCATPMQHQAAVHRLSKHHGPLQPRLQAGSRLAGETRQRQHLQLKPLALTQQPAQQRAPKKQQQQHQQADVLLSQSSMHLLDGAFPAPPVAHSVQPAWQGRLHAQVADTTPRQLRLEAGAELPEQLLRLLCRQGRRH